MQQLNMPSVQAALEDGNSTATAYHVLAVIAFDGLPTGLYARETDGTGIKAVLEDVYGVDPHQTVVDKINAIILALTTDAFEEDPEAFLSICSALSGGNPGFPAISDVTYPEAVVAFIEVRINRSYDVVLSPSVQNTYDKLRQQVGEEPIDWVAEAIHENLSAIYTDLQSFGIDTDLINAALSTVK